MKLKDKLHKKLKITKETLKNFGIIYAIYDFMTEFVFRDKNKKITQQLHYKKHEKVKKYLLNKYKNTINKYMNEKENDCVIETNAPVWIFWYQGLEYAPDIVKACININKSSLKNHKITIITKENILELVDIPQYIIEKVENGTISLTHFSDILRVSLLYKYGGIWIDATILCNKEISPDIYNYTFYTVKHNLFSDYHVCKGKWFDAFLASAKGNKLMKYMQECFFEYWKNENSLITYLLIDCFFAIGYENIKFIKDEIDNVPINNQSIFELENNLSKPYNKEFFDIDNLNTYIFKTNYKRKLLIKKDEKSTYYNEILKKGKIEEKGKDI